MSLPVREQVLQALATRVSAVRNLEAFGIQQVPASGILSVVVDGEEQDAGSDHEHSRMEMDVTIARIVLVSGRKGDGWHEQANTALADLIQEALATDTRLGGLAEHIEYTGGAAGEIPDGSRGIFAQAFFRVRYRFVRGNPYLIDEA